MLQHAHAPMPFMDVTLPGIPGSPYTPGGPLSPFLVESAPGGPWKNML